MSSDCATTSIGSANVLDNVLGVLPFTILLEGVVKVSTISQSFSINLRKGEIERK
jgi:hypothetical protein